MTEISGVTRVGHSDRAGTGLVEWDALDPDSLVSGAPVQRGCFCDENPETGYMAGVWDCTAFVDRPGPYTVDEFMLLLEGSVVLALPDGKEITVSPGEVFVIPKGFECQWKMPGYLRKVFMIVDDPVNTEARNPSLQRITLPDVSATAPDGPIEVARTWFENSTGRMRVSVRSFASASAPGTPVPYHRLFHVLEGSLTLTAEGASMAFTKGETGYTHANAAHAMTVAPNTRLVEATYLP